MVVRLPEDSLPGAFAGVCACKQRGGCDRPGAVPVELAEHVDFVEGIGDRLDASRDLRQRARAASRDYNPGNRRLAAKRKSRTAPETTLQTREFDALSRSGPWYPACLKEEATPPCLKKAYNCSLQTAAASSNSQGVALFGGQFFSPADLAQFESEFELPTQAVRVINDNKA